MRKTDNSMLPGRGRKFKRFDSSLFIEFRQLKGAGAYLLGLTRNISCEGFSFTSRELALEPGQRLEFQLRQPRSNVMIAFIGDVIWQRQEDIKYSAGVKFCDVNKKNKKIMLKVISDSCNVPVNDLIQSSDPVKSLQSSRHENAGPAPDIIQNYKPIFRIANRQRTEFSWFYRTALICAATTVVLFLPAVVENIEDVSFDTGTKTTDSMALNDTTHMALVTYQNGQINTPAIREVADANQSQPAENDTLFETIKVNTSLTNQQKKPDIALPEQRKKVTEENKFFIQVASLKDPDIAYNMLSELKQVYPATYLFIKDNFYKVRIPDIKTDEQGLALIKDIKAKFNIQPILVKKVP